ncbi:MAG: histidinol-phosphate transaminase [Bacteroidales bacterium]
MINNNITDRTMNIDSLVRKNIRGLAPYSTARDESDIKCAIFLDANELPYSTGYNRYPDPHQRELKRSFAAIAGNNITEKNIFAGNGSDEAIDLIIRIFCNPGVDNVVSIAPTYGMYKVCASLNDVEFRESQLERNFSFNSKSLLQKCDNNTKIIFICSPNNPTGNLLDKNEIQNVLDNFKGIVVVDEAYIDFSGDEGFIPYIDRFPNLVVLRTMSKSKGMAAIRVGFAVTSELIAGYMAKVKYPYNVNRISQELAVKALKERVGDSVSSIKADRERLTEELKGISGVKEIYKSDSNFILVKFEDSASVYKRLLEAGIVTRERGSVPGCEDTLRITVGKPLENSLLLTILKGAPERETYNVIELARITKETSVSLRIYPDGCQDTSVTTGVGFLDHMLDQIKVHGGISFDLEAKGDLNVDPHHTIEDVAIVLGEGLGKLVSLKKGYNRYGFVLPMDESRAEVLIDLGGRGAFVWDVNFKGEKIGDFPSEMFRHMFSTLSSSGKFTLHISASGDNDHHIAEAIFKAFARALRIALSNSPDEYVVPSSKGEVEGL